MKTNPNDRINQECDHENKITNYGLTKREYFAAMAMQGILAGVYGVEERMLVSPSAWVARSVEYADALIEKLNK